MNRVWRPAASLARRGIDDLAAFLFPEICRHCGAGDIDASASSPAGQPRSRLQNGRLRRRLAGRLSLPLRILCDVCCGELVPLRHTRATDPSWDVVAFEPSPALFTLVHAWKYDGIVELSAWLGAHLARVARHQLARGPAALVPVPLHAERLAERGFNQSALLAKDVGRRLGVPVWESLLERCMPTMPLARLAHDARRTQVHGAFACRVPPRAGDVRVVLVDDVVTTGATRDAARDALGAHAAERSAFLGLCRALEASPWGSKSRAAPRRGEPACEQPL